LQGRGLFEALLPFFLRGSIRKCWIEGRVREKKSLPASLFQSEEKSILSREEQGEISWAAAIRFQNSFSVGVASSHE
jgi:hypothetical protein